MKKNTNRTKKSRKNVTVPLAKTVQVSNRIPAVRASGTHLCVSHREYLTELSGASDFTVYGFLVNPGLTETTPWLSAIASRYEYYRIKALRLEYISRCPTTVRGTIAMAMDKDVRDDDPASYQEFMNYMGAKSSSPWNSFDIKALPDHLGPNRLYTRSTLISDTDQRLYDWGKLLLAVQGDEVSFGDVYISYDIEFSVPELHGTPSQTAVPDSPGATVSMSNNSIGQSLPLVNDSVELQSPLAALAEVVGVQGLPFKGSPLLAEAIGNIKGLKQVLLTSANSPCTAGNLGAIPSSHSALLLPEGSYHIRLYWSAILKQNNATARSFKVFCSGTRQQPISAFLLEDKASTVSAFQDMCMTVAPESFENWTAGTSAGHFIYTSPTYTQNSTLGMYINVDFDFMSDGVHPICPTLTLNTTNSFPDAPDNGLYWTVSGMLGSQLEIAVTQPF